MQNCRRKAADKIVSTDRRTDGQNDGQPWRFQYTPSPLHCGWYNEQSAHLKIDHDSHWYRSGS